ncbi:MAG TPA: TonB-dependent receptor [Chitinophagaceae bacterium]
MQRVVPILLLIFFINHTGFAQTDSSVTRPAFRIQRNSFSGKVTDAATGLPLAAATVYFTDLKIGAATSAEGNFVFNGVPAGKHLLEVSFVGYASVSEYIIIRGEVKKDFTLTAEVVERNEVVVTGLSASTQARRTATPITTMRRQDLLRTASINLVDAISRQPGVAQLSTGPAIAKPVIRGLGYNRVITIHDGVRQEGQQWGDEHGLEIDEYSVSKIEILKGPASLMYGSDAMAGVINIMSNIPAPVGRMRGNFVSNYQSNNRMRGFGLNLGANHGGFNWNASGSLKAAGDYENKYDGRVYNSKFNERTLGGYVGYNGSWGYTHFIASYYKQDLGIVEGDRNDDGLLIKQLPGGLEVLPSEDDFNSTDPQIPWQRVQHTKIISDNSFNLGQGRFALIAGFQRNQRTEFGNIDDPAEKELFFDLGTFTYSGIYHLEEKNSWRTAIGVNGMRQQNRNKGAEVLIPEYSLFDIGGFIFSQKSWDDVTLSGGIRFDNRSLNSKAFIEGSEVKFLAFKKDFSNVSGSIGLSYLPSDLVTLKLNIARGFRAPTVAELSSNGTHEGTNRYEYGDTDLKSETSFQVDAGFQLESDHISLEATLFSNNIKNFIFYRKLQAAGGGDSTVEVDGDFVTAFRFDQRRAGLNGLELSLDIHPHPLDWLHFENTFSLVNGRFRDAIEGSKNIPFIPAARLISEVRADFLNKGRLFRNLSLSFEVDKTFDQNNAFTAYETETATRGYALLNASMGVDVVSKGATLFSLFLHANNIADEAYQHHLNRLKYAAENVVTGRRGVFNMGRNFSIKLNVPLSVALGK